MQAVIFDLDGVLVNSMLTHFQAWKVAFAKIAGIEIAERDVYLLEGMRGMELVEKIFGQNNFSSNRSLARKVHDEKSKIFKGIRSSEPFEGVREIIDCIRCSKAVVSGSTRNDVETILEEAFGRGSFDVTITADDIEKGKPDPSAFLEALSRMKVEPRDALVVENAPPGVRAANSAGIACYVVLNNTPLVRSDFKSIIPEGRILEKTGLLRKVLCK
ncbi:MAG TPA: HAD family phosphatase [Nitrososphaera sp.]|nr:HAD family phosphatase [Nitrososphaera sp.]